MSVRRVKIDKFYVTGSFEDDGRIFLFDELKSVERPDSIRLDGIFVILCVDGYLTLSIDHREFVAHKKRYYNRCA